MLKIGVTGGIGSGKSTICRIFEIIGITVFYADIEAKKLISTDKNIIKEVKNKIGINAYFDDGRLNRLYVKNLIFSKPKMRIVLNNIIHPKVKKLFNTWAKDKNTPYVIKEAALIFESGSDKELDKIIVVTAPENLRVNRIIERDGITEKQVKSIINSQISDKEKIKHADYVIKNDNSELVIQKVLAIHKNLLKLTV